MRGLKALPASWNTICIRRRAARNGSPSSSDISMLSNRTVPAVGSISRIRSRPVVDLPQPLSPTSASVSPRTMVKDTSSTARTAPVTRLTNTPEWTG